MSTTPPFTSRRVRPVPPRHALPRKHCENRALDSKTLSFKVVPASVLLGGRAAGENLFRFRVLIQHRLHYLAHFIDGRQPNERGGDSVNFMQHRHDLRLFPPSLLNQLRINAARLVFVDGDEAFQGCGLGGHWRIISGELPHSQTHWRRSTAHNPRSTARPAMASASYTRPSQRTRRFSTAPCRCMYRTAGGGLLRRDGGMEEVAALLSSASSAGRFHKLRA